MRYSISNAIPHNPKSEKHPYENLVKSAFFSPRRSKIPKSPMLQGVRKKIGFGEKKARWGEDGENSGRKHS